MQQPTLSMRILWPFARELGADPRAVAIIGEFGVRPGDLIERDRRLECRIAMQALARCVEVFDNPLLGLQAGANADEGAFDVLEHAARSTKNLGAALEVMDRYGRILHEAADMRVQAEGERVMWCYTPRVPHGPAGNDFAIMSALSFARRNCEIYIDPPEVWVMHDEPAYASAYKRFLESHVRFGAPHNAIIFPAVALHTRMKARNPVLAVAFEDRARQMVQEFSKEGSITRRVREALSLQFACGNVSMEETAKRLETSVATLRRRLQAEGSSFGDVLEAMRKDASIYYLTRSDCTVTDIAFMLGFSDVRAFSRAFRRWTGTAPTEYRG